MCQLKIRRRRRRMIRSPGHRREAGLEVVECPRARREVHRLDRHGGDHRVAVGVATRSVFGGSVTPPSTTLRGAAPFSVSTQIVHGDYWRVWLEQPLPDPNLWPPLGSDPDTVLRFLGGLGAVDDLTWARIVLTATPAARRRSGMPTRSSSSGRNQHRSRSSAFPTKASKTSSACTSTSTAPGSPAHELIGFATPSRKPTPRIARSRFHPVRR